MNLKYSIKVRSNEKELYRICKDLEKYGRTSFQYSNSFKQQDIAKKLGMRGKSLYENGLFFPPARNRRHNINIVALPIGVKISEKKVRKDRFFFFERE